MVPRTRREPADADPLRRGVLGDARRPRAPRYTSSWFLHWSKGCGECRSLGGDSALAYGGWHSRSVRLAVPAAPFSLDYVGSFPDRRWRRYEVCLSAPSVNGAYLGRTRCPHWRGCGAYAWRMASSRVWT